MNTPTDIKTFREGEFRRFVISKSFKMDGDSEEKKHWQLLQSDLPNNQEFWKSFVVPLTNRIDESAKNSSIRFREGVDPLLQYISGANYSIFVHFAFARVIMSNWNEMSLDAVYTKLASAFDVFEALAIKFHLLLCECRGSKSPLLSELSKDVFLKIASDYYDNKYHTLYDFYSKIGKKPPPIHLPSVTEIFDEFFHSVSARKDYRTVSGQIRAFRNAIVHDVRIGMLFHTDKSLLVPKTSEISKYRHWSNVETAGKDAAIIGKDFHEVREQCKKDIDRSVRVVNELYKFILEQFISEFYNTGRSKLRQWFGVHFTEAVSELESQSTESPTRLDSLPHDASRTTQSSVASGIYVPTPGTTSP